MNNVTQIVQKVRQAPWRVQRQWIGLFLLGFVVVAMVAGIYLNVTVRATLAGRETQMLRADIATNRRANADLETQLAGLTSMESMQQRADAKGFGPVSLDDVTYVVVPGYTPSTSVNLSVPQVQSDTPVILPEYSESLFDWFTREIAASAPAGVQP
jgi:cell division protein FtsL